jgi:hypothetical protein
MGLQGHASRRAAQCRAMPFCPCYFRVDLSRSPRVVLVLCVRREALFDHMEVGDRPSACCRSSGLELEAT